MINNRCTGIMGLVFGHKFIPVIKKGEPKLSQVKMNIDPAWHDEMMSLIDSTRPETFHGCICQRCGAVTGEKK